MSPIWAQRRATVASASVWLTWGQPIARILPFICPITTHRPSWRWIDANWRPSDGNALRGRNSVGGGGVGKTLESANFGLEFRNFGLQSKYGVA